MSLPRVWNRRRFLRRALGQGGTLELSCERLYIRYLEAGDGGYLPAFFSSLREETGGADEIRLTECEWLARDDFRQALERAFERDAWTPVRRLEGR